MEKEREIPACKREGEPTEHLKIFTTRDPRKIRFKGKTFCLTGIFQKLRKDVEAEIVKRGGIVRGDVSGKTDFLVIGGMYNPPWSSERKVNAAHETRRTHVVPESVFQTALESPEIEGPEIPEEVISEEDKERREAQMRQREEARKKREADKARLKMEKERKEAEQMSFLTVPPPEIFFDGGLFFLAGNFESGQKEKIRKMIEECNGFTTEILTESADYIIAGGLGKCITSLKKASSSWPHIPILSEQDLLDSMQRHKKMHEE